MKTLLKSLLMCCLVASSLVYLSGCKDDDDPEPQLTGDSKTYVLGPVSNPAISGTVTFAERDDDQILITIQLIGTQGGGTHPAHIHANSAAEGGEIVLDLTDINGATGKSETVVKALNDNTPLTYADLLAFDGYVNVHLSTSDLGTLIAQGDIGENELTGDTKIYALGPVSDPGISGTATFAKRVNGETLVTVSLIGTTAGDSHPSHIHANSAAKGGGIVIDLNDIDGATGKSRTNVSELNNAIAITYDELVNFNGYLNVHLSSSVLGTLIAQGDIGGNELTTDKKDYILNPVDNPAISGVATFTKRKNGTTLITVALVGTTPGLSHNSHIHANSAAKGGGIVINLSPVSGTTGMARSQVDSLNNGTLITYDELLNFNGYLNVHFGSGLIGQGDIGANELTGEVKVYALGPVDNTAISGVATFAKRKNGTTLVTVALTGTTAGLSHASHIHANSAAQTGGIAINLTNVNGTTGMARSQVDSLNNGTLITYDELLNFNGYLNVHFGSGLIAQGDIGQNELTGDHQHYDLLELGGSGVSGLATFEKRKNGKALITLELTGTVAGGDHPAHIHANDAATGGGIVLDLRNVSGATGKSTTSINTLNDTTPITYDGLVAFNGHINVHLSPTELGTRIAQGNIGSNAD